MEADGAPSTPPLPLSVLRFTGIQSYSYTDQRKVEADVEVTEDRTWDLSLRKPRTSQLSHDCSSEYQIGLRIPNRPEITQIATPRPQNSTFFWARPSILPQWEGAPPPKPTLTWNWVPRWRLHRHFWSLLLFWLFQTLQKPWKLPLFHQGGDLLPS